MAGRDLVAEGVPTGRDLVASPQKFTSGEIVEDVGSASQQGYRNVNEDFLDLASMPLKGIERHKRGLEKWRSKDSTLEAGLGYLGEIFNLTKPTATGELITTATQTGQPEYNIPAGEGPDWLEPLKSGTRVGTEMLITAPLSGPKYLVNALKATAGGAAGAGAGQYLAGDTGEAIGALTGALGANPKELWDAAKAVGGIAKIPVKWYRKWAHRNNINLANATDDELRAGIAELTRQMHPDGDVPGTYADDLINKVDDAAQAGNKGTAGQLSGDKGLLNFEADVSKTERLSGVSTQNKRIQDEITDTLTSVAKGDAGQASVLPKAQAASQQKTLLDDAAKAADKVETTAQTGLAKTMEAEKKALENARNVGTTTETSSRLARTTLKIKKEAKQAASDLWALAGNPDIPLNKINTGLKDFFGSMNPERAKVLKEGLGKGYKMLDNLEVDPDFEALSAIMSQLSKDSTDMSGAAKQVVGQIQDILYDAMGANAGGARGKAAAAWKSYMNRFGPGSTVGKNLKKGLPETNVAFGQNITGSGDVGVGKSSTLMGVTDGMVGQELDDFMRARFNRDHVDRATGLIKPDAVAQFERKFGDQLSPALKSELRAAQAASKATQVASKTTLPEAHAKAKAIRADADKASNAVTKTPEYKLGAVGTDPADVSAEITRVMKPGKDRVKNVTSLVKSTGGDATAMENLRTAAMDSFNEGLYDAKGIFMADKALKRMAKNKEVYLASGLFDKQTIDNIEAALEAGKKLNMHKNSAGLARLPVEKRPVLMGLAALAGAKGGAVAFGSPLIGAAIGRREMVKLVESMTTKQTQKLAYELATNPEKFRPILEKLKQGNITAARISGAFKQIINTVIRASVAGDE